ncbi:MAG: hypothetical protein AW10_00128 [Candidatus Accumulibacter appositus]|uniref:Lipoprotein n=1 Tax=Candidatus Accumulibacter appositus TaxID=1454003 RepID=A0A011NJX0_9PROT|nr:hypothetical protein [Accumulibacter sp.]EXI83053.1 MAG: hypothetical protein AW10_00128 [Candidatus Accumulibacter appositus]HRF04047.1 hypothetical protein [Accumulibacter sp.]
MRQHDVRLHPLASLIAICSLAACQPALIYGERTSFNVAAIQLNDNVGEPAKINFGFVRSVATSAPPRGGEDQVIKAPAAANDKGSSASAKVHEGEAVSVFSNFRLNQTAQNAANLPLTNGDLAIRTRFASGQAAITIAGDVKAVTAILGPRTIQPDTPDTAKRRETLTACVEKIDDQASLEAIVKALPGSMIGSVNHKNFKRTRSFLISDIADANSAELQALSALPELIKFCK